MNSRVNLPLFLALILVSTGLFANQAVCAAAVETASGLVEGVAEDGIMVFRGIPFAGTTAGEHRWRPPHPATSWEGVRSAAEFGPICPQNPRSDLPFDLGPQSEDCLNLNIWTPRNQAGREKWAVMVWIYGGNFRSGAGSWPNYDGARLARKGVVVVTFNYRLGYLGLLAHPSLNETRQGEPIANYALMDQIAALKWVQRNIAAFGGDPGRVTIFGESAGGVSVNFCWHHRRPRACFTAQYRKVAVSGWIRPDVSMSVSCCTARSMRRRPA